MLGWKCICCSPKMIDRFCFTLSVHVFCSCQIVMCVFLQLLLLFCCKWLLLFWVLSGLSSLNICLIFVLRPFGGGGVFSRARVCIQCLCFFWHIKSLTRHIISDFHNRLLPASHMLAALLVWVAFLNNPLFLSPPQIGRKQHFPSGISSIYENDPSYHWMYPGCTWMHYINHIFTIYKYLSVSLRPTMFFLHNFQYKISSECLLS